MLFFIVCCSVLNGIAQTPAPFKGDNGLFGYKNANGKVVIKPIYEKAYKFSEGLAVVCNDDEKCGCVNEKGKVAIPLIYDKYAVSEHYFSEGLIAFSLKKQVGFLDKEGKEIIPFKYEWAYNFNEGLAHVAEGYGYSQETYFIDKTGKKVFSSRDLAVERFKNGIAEVSRYGSYGYIDKTGKEIVPIKYQSVKLQDDGYIQIKENGKYGWLNSKYESFIPAKYELADLQEDGYIQIRENGKYGWLTKNYESFIPAKYESVSKPQFTNFIIVKENGKYGCMKKNYELFIPTLYGNDINVYRFMLGSGLADLNLDGLWGFADSTGKIIIPFQFESIKEEFKNGVAVVELKGERFSIDVTGKKIEGTTIVVKKEAARETMSDVDGKKYFTVTIGKQTWMASNLTVQHYRNGDPIEIVTDNKTWTSTKAGAACYYNNDKELDFGVDLFYNTYTINDDRNVCPVGWHIPSPEEGRLLIKTVEELALAGLSGAAKQTYNAATERGISTAALKDALVANALKSTFLWMQDQNGTNTSGFNLTPTGMRNEFGSYIFRGQVGCFWTIKKGSKATGEAFQLNADEITWHTASTLGYPIRCIKD